MYISAFNVTIDSFQLARFVANILNTMCLKKVSTFKLSVTLSNLNGFSKFLRYWKAYEIYYKTHTTLST